MSLALAAMLGAAFVVVEWRLGRIDLLETDAHVAADFRIALGMIALVAYLPGAFVAAVRGAERTLRDLAPAFGQRSEAEAAAASVTGRRESATLRRTGVIGAVVGLAVPLATNLELETWFLSELPVEAVVHRLLLAPLGWLTARFGAVVWSESSRLASLGSTALRADLLDLRPLAPLARAGLRHAFLNAGALSILLMGLRETGVAPGMPFVVALASLANLALGMLGLWLALRGGHEAIGREKQRASEAANTAIRGLRGPGARHATGALADALAWKRFVAEAPDWPIDFPTLQRFVIPFALPFASLLVGAAFEVVMGRLIPS
jgi:hypothetical protein